MNDTSLGPPNGRGRAAVAVGVAIFVGWIASFGLLGPAPVHAQPTESDDTTLAERYRSARLQVVAQRLLGPSETLPVLGPVPIPTSSDTLRPDWPGQDATPKRAFPLSSVRPVRRQDRTAFRERFAETNWAFLGTSPRPTFFDTTRTPELRARLQAQFGAPTQTLEDIRPGSSSSQSPDSTWAGRAQFEYWFVVNDSIPVRVTDARGPRDRGLIVTTDRRLRDRLKALRRTLLAPLQQSVPALYVDYYYDPRVDRWYRTGYDGQTYFLDEIAPADIIPGHRPRLDSSRARPSDSSNSSTETSSGR